MEPITVNSKVGADGVLHLELPLGLETANRPVQVTVQPLPVGPANQQEWQRFLAETAGAWQGEFERPPQGDWELRDPLP